MRRYFFHTQTDVRHTDEDGVELSSPAEARTQGARLFGQTMKEGPERFWLSQPWSMTITDAAGLVICELGLGASMGTTAG